MTADRPVPDPEAQAITNAAFVLRAHCSTVTTNSYEGMAEALAAAGLLRAPDPALAERLREIAALLEHHEDDAADLRAAADALGGTP